MTDALLAHLESVRKQLEKEKGKFSFFALVRRSDSSDLDLLVSAPWLTEEKMRGLAQVVQRVYSDDTKDWWTQIAHIFTLNESDPDNRALMAAIGPARELRVLDWPRVPGPAIEQAWVLWNDPRPDEDRDVIVHYIDEFDAMISSPALSFVNSCQVAMGAWASSPIESALPSLWRCLRDCPHLRARADRAAVVTVLLRVGDTCLRSARGVQHDGPSNFTAASTRGRFCCCWLGGFRSAKCR